MFCSTFLCLAMPGRALWHLPVFFSSLSGGRERCAASAGHGDTVPACLLDKIGWDAGTDPGGSTFLRKKDHAVPLCK